MDTDRERKNGCVCRGKPSGGASAESLKGSCFYEDYESAARYRDEIRALKAKAAEGRDEKGGRTDEPMV
ncbi:MAG: UvrB/UvrC motif-containing protein [Clostridium sp.]